MVQQEHMNWRKLEAKLFEDLMKDLKNQNNHDGLDDIHNEINPI